MQIKQKSKLPPIKKIILSIIIFLFILVIILTIFAIFNTPEKRVKSEIEHLTHDYYENYLYPKISENAKDISETLEKYQEKGLSPILLRQLLFSDRKDQKTIQFLRNHCDENKTAVRFYPEPPFSKTSYNVEYTYNCNLDI